MNQVDALFTEVKAQIEKSMEKKCIELTQRLCFLGLNFREYNENAHNFTGNLINSIVAVLYKDGVEKYAEYASRTVGKPAIRVKMTAPKSYHFRRDWQGAESHYMADEETNRGWGIDDADRFVKQYHPKGKGWVVTLAYPVEYAAYVEKHRQSTGIAQVEMDITSSADNIAQWIVNDVKLPMESSFAMWDYVTSKDLSYKNTFAKQVNNKANWTIATSDNGDPLGGFAPMAPLPF